MVSYIILTYLLSIVGGSIYHFWLRPYLMPSYQKMVLWSIIVGSFATPIGIDYWTSGKLSTDQWSLPLGEVSKNDTIAINAVKPIGIDSASYVGITYPSFLRYSCDVPVFCESPTSCEPLISPDIINEYCPEDHELTICYEEALQDQNFCSCKVVTMDNLLKYKPKPTYELIVASEPRMASVAWIAIFLIMGILGLKIMYLVFVIATSRREKWEIGGEWYTILFPNKALAVGSFQLGQSYIIWQQEMNHLAESEQKAIMWHEISHLKQKDTLFKILLHIAQTCWWLNPVYYYFARELDRISEYIADEFAVAKLGSAKLYASLLVKMKRQQKLALAHHFKTSLLKIRVKRLLKNENRYGLMVALPALVIIGVGFVALTHTCLPIIDKQLEKIEVHEKLWVESNISGKPLFCKHCLFEE